MSEQEGYGPSWIKAVVMVHPLGQIHFLGGDMESGDGDQPHKAAKYLKHVKDQTEKEKMELAEEVAFDRGYTIAGRNLNLEETREAFGESHSQREKAFFDIGYTARRDFGMNFAEAKKWIDQPLTGEKSPPTKNQTEKEKK